MFVSAEGSSLNIGKETAKNPELMAENKAACINREPSKLIANEASWRTTYEDQKVVQVPLHTINHSIAFSLCHCVKVFPVIFEVSKCGHSRRSSIRASEFKFGSGTRLRSKRCRSTFEINTR